MCDPVSISIGLTAAGSVAQAAGQAKAQKAQRGAVEAERIRQKGYQDQSDAALAESKAHATKSSQDIEQGKAEGERKAAYDAANAAAQAPVVAAGDNLAGDQTANAVVNNEASKVARNTNNYATQQGIAKAALQGFNDVQLGNSLYNARQLQDQARIGHFMQGSSNVLPLEMEAAARQGQGLRTLGSALAAGGSIVGMGAGAGWWGNSPAASTIGTTATTTLKPGMTLGNVLAPSQPLTLQNFQNGGLLPIGTQLTGGAYDAGTGLTSFRLR